LRYGEPVGASIYYLVVVKIPVLDKIFIKRIQSESKNSRRENNENVIRIKETVCYFLYRDFCKELKELKLDSLEVSLELFQFKLMGPQSMTLDLIAYLQSLL
jgi:hypothetical protein